MASKDGSVPKGLPRSSSSGNKRASSPAGGHLDSEDDNNTAASSILSPSVTTTGLKKNGGGSSSSSSRGGSGSIKNHTDKASTTGIDDLGGLGGCLVCGKDNDHAKLLLCELCNGEYHTYCLAPPLGAIPENEWFCDRCKQVDNLDVMVAALPESWTCRYGEIVWAQGGVGYGWWPAVIYDPRLTTGVARMQAMKNLGRNHLVYFFECSETPFEILAQHKIMFWEQGILEDCHLGRSARASSKSRLADFRCAMHAASIEGSKPKEKRLDWNHQGGPRDGTSGMPIIPPSPIRPLGVLRKQQQENNKGSRKPKVPAPAENNGRKRMRVHPRGDVPASTSPKQGPRKKRRTAEAEPFQSSAPLQFSPLPDPEDGDMFCRVVRDWGPAQAVTNLGFVRLRSRKRGTFAQLRRVIEHDLVPDAIPQEWVWRFLVPNLGPVSIKQENKFGPVLPFLLQTSSPEAIGDGSLQNPIQICLTETIHHT